MTTWHLKTTENQLHKIVKAAQTQGPQFLAEKGKIIGVLMSNTCYDNLTKKSQTLYDLLVHSPLAEAEDIFFERDESLTREVSI
jgi:hypothetical protein